MRNYSPLMQCSLHDTCVALWVWVSASFQQGWLYSQSSETAFRSYLLQMFWMYKSSIYVNILQCDHMSKKIMTYKIGHSKPRKRGWCQDGIWFFNFSLFNWNLMLYNYMSCFEYKRHTYLFSHQEFLFFLKSKLIILLTNDPNDTYLDLSANRSAANMAASTSTMSWESKATTILWWIIFFSRIMLAILPKVLKKQKVSHPKYWKVLNSWTGKAELDETLIHVTLEFFSCAR